VGLKFCVMLRALRHSPQTLSPTQISAYDKDGFLLGLRAMSADQARQMRAEFEAAEALEGKSGNLFLNHGHTRWPWMYDIVANPVILDAVSDLIGANIMVRGVSVFAKEPGSSSFVGWHQDVNYWGLEPDDGIVTAWVALTDVEVCHGPMEFLRGSHLEQVKAQRDTYDPSNLLSRGQEIVWDQPVSSSQIEMATMSAGMFSLHHVRLAHQSGANSGSDRRIGIAIRYMPTCTRSRSLEDTAMVVRGSDTCGNFILETPPTDADDVAQHHRGRAAKTASMMRDADHQRAGQKDSVAFGLNVPRHLRARL